MSLPVVVAHDRHRGGNSTPLDIPVGDRSGPVTEVQRRVGVAVHRLPTPGADPDPLAEAEVSKIAAAAVMGLGGGKPAVSDHQPTACPAGLVGQGGADLAKPGLVDGAPERASAHAPGNQDR